MTQVDRYVNNASATDRILGYQRHRWLLIIGSGTTLLLCALLLVGGGFFLSSREWRSNDETPTLASSVVQATDTPTPETTVTDTPTLSPPTTIPTEIVEPELGPITFALTVTEEDEPLHPASSFEEGLTEIHAVFDYGHMSKEYTWERVWYHNGQERLRNAENWTGEETGQFDYFLDTGGQALPPGQWLLELYVEGELKATGQFTVNAKVETSEPTAVPTVEPTAEPTDEPQPSPPPPRTYQLAYSKWDGGSHSVYIADTNGQNEQLIFTRAAGPSFSPDNKRLFFLGEQGVNQQIRDGRVTCEFGTISGGIVAVDLTWPPGDICQVKFDTWFCERKTIELQAEPSDVCTENGISVYQNLDWKEGTARWASVSPDGVAIAYEASPGGDTNRIYFLKMLGASQQFRYEILGEQGSWSPDGQKMVYRSGRDNKQGLWISHREDRDHTPITNSGTDSFPAWSPDGQTIAFSREADGNVDIYTVNVNGSNLKQLTNDPAPDTLPVYTPAGEIIFRSARSDSWGIWKMSGTGANQREIIPNAGVGPDWAFSKMDVK